MKFERVVEVSARVAATPKRSEKIALLRGLFDEVRREDERVILALVGLLTGNPRQGRLGVGWSGLADVSSAGTAVADSTLTVGDVDVALQRLAHTQGSGSQRGRAGVLGVLFGDLTVAEQQFLQRVLMGEMRHGANEGIVSESIAKAAGVSLPAMRRAVMMLGDLGAAAVRALRGDDIDAIGLVPLVGVQPMLAGTAASVTDALRVTGRASVEWKLDGARVQVHRQGDEVRVLTRSLRDISARAPEIVSVAQRLEPLDFVLDGEALGLDPEGNPLKFQDSMNVDTALRPFFFDVLHVDGRSMVDLPLEQRKAALSAFVPQQLRLPTIDTDDPEVAEAFGVTALAAGHEGVMVKALDSTYQAGRRGATWRKVKPVHTLDLVVLAAEWGHGRRAGWLSNLHLGARGVDGTFVMVGKTFKGLTDDLLRWQTDAFQQIGVGQEGHVLHLRPEIVVEIALDGVQRSTRYPGGVALRFARVRRYRSDKRAEDTDTIERVQSML